jgi:hypothetical protein
MDRSIPAIITGLVLLAILFLMWRSWRKRSLRDAGLAAGYPLPVTAGVTLTAAEAYYVATTPRDTPLERLAIRGLGFRARAAVTVTDVGIVLDLDGNEPVFVPATAIDSVGAARVAIDRVVEADGLVRLSWRLAAAGERQAVDSFFRIIDPSDRAGLIDSIRTIASPNISPNISTNISPATSPAPHDESEA